MMLEKNGYGEVRGDLEFSIDFTIIVISRKNDAYNFPINKIVPSGLRGAGKTGLGKF